MHKPQLYHRWPWICVCRSAEEKETSQDDIHLLKNWLIWSVNTVLRSRPYKIFCVHSLVLHDEIPVTFEIIFTSFKTHDYSIVLAWGFKTVGYYGGEMVEDIITLHWSIFKLLCPLRINWGCFFVSRLLIVHFWDVLIALQLYCR